MLEINYDVPPFFALQVEPVEGCSLSCSFCGISSIRDNGANALIGAHGKNSAPYKYMTIETATSIADSVKQLGWNPRVEFAVHGEPSMHPKLDELIGIFRSRLPNVNIMVTSNGSGFLKDTNERILALFDAGLNTLALDDYLHSGGWVGRIREALALDVPVYEYPADKRGNPHTRHSGKLITIIHDISENTTGTHTLTNQGGNSLPKETVVARCAKPFRELSVRWDGMVAICCDDWKGEYKVGNVNKVGLDKIWYSEAMEAARRHLYLGDRSFGGACVGCNVKSTRVGLLPDKLGKKTMAAPDAESAKVIKRALAGPVFSIKVMR